MAQKNSKTSNVFPFPNSVNVSNFVTIKLTEGNYLSWMTQMKSLCLTQKLTGFIDGSIPCPAEHVGDSQELNPTYESWMQSDALVKSWIISTLSEEAMGHIFELTTAAQVWEELANHFAQKTETREFELLSQLNNLRREGKTLSTFLSEFKGLLNQLSSIGKPMTDSAKTFRLLESLGQDYESFKDAMFRPPIPTFNVVISQLQAHEARHVRCEPIVRPTTNDHIAFTAQRGGRGGRGYSRGRGTTQPFSSQGRGFGPAATGNRPSATTQVAPQNLSTKSTGNNPTFPADTTLTCQICERRGHSAVSCWRRFDHTFQSGNIPKALASIQLDENTSNNPEWVADSGASAHIVDSAGSDQPGNPPQRT